MATSHILGMILAITSAAVWGSGDFCGGIATRRSSQLQVLTLSALSGLVILLGLLAASGMSIPTSRGALWAILAGISGALGIAMLYRALSVGRAATVAPLAAVIGATLPVIFSLLTVGIPPLGQQVGFVIAILGIWLVTSVNNGTPADSLSGTRLAVLAGIGFGGFFIFIAKTDQGTVLAPLIIARCAMLLIAVLITVLAGERLPKLNSNPIALLAGALDVGANVAYLLAVQFTRLDVAAVLSSLYPVMTVLLARTLTHEQVTRVQWAGVGLCFSAIALIAL